MQTKLSKLKSAWESGNKLEALRIAAKFPQLGEEKTAIMQGWSAYQNPAFYREIGKNPEALLESAYQALQSKYSLG